MAHQLEWQKLRGITAITSLRIPSLDKMPDTLWLANGRPYSWIFDVDGIELGVTMSDGSSRILHLSDRWEVRRGTTGRWNLIRNFGTAPIE